MVDTGADGTFVPTTLLEALDVPIEYMTNVRSHLGERSVRIAVHRIDLILFDTYRLSGIYVVSDDLNQEIVIGRNVLNLLHLQLDGSRKTLLLREI